jgi:hypothetical protein
VKHFTELVEIVIGVAELLSAYGLVTARRNFSRRIEGRNGS